MKSFVNEERQPIVPSYVRLSAYKKLLDAHKALQIGSTKNKDGRGQMEREVRYTDIKEVKENLRRIGRNIGLANETRNRTLRADIIWESLNLLVNCYLATRTVLDLHYITETRWADFVLNAEDLRRQLYGWYMYTLEEVKKQKSGKDLDRDNDLDLFFDFPEPPRLKLSKYAGLQSGTGPLVPERSLNH